MDEISSRISENSNSPPTTRSEEIRLNLPQHSMYLSGIDVFLKADKCYIDCDLNEPCEVADIFSFKVKFYADNNQPYAVTTRHYINVEIENLSDGSKIPYALNFTDAAQLDDGIGNEIKVSFNATKIGVYSISLKPNNIPLKGSPFRKTFLPGPISPAHTVLKSSHHSAFSVVPCSLGETTEIRIDAMDEFKNNCISRLDEQDLNKKCKLRIYEVTDPLRNIPCKWRIIHDGKRNSLSMHFAIHAPGIFKASLSLNEKEIINGGFDLIVLTGMEYTEMIENVQNKNLNARFDCLLIKTSKDGVNMNQSSRSRDVMNGDASKAKPVVCHITPKKLVIKESFLKVFPKRLFTFKICPSTKMLIDDVNKANNHPTLIIEDKFQSRVVLTCERRNILAATYFAKFFKSIGFSKTFKEKASYLNRKLRKHHKLCHYQHHSRKQIHFMIDRSDLLHSAMKHLSDKDWRKQFVIYFENEIGIDYGGLSREWNSLLCKALFDPRSESGEGTTGGSGMFRRTKDDPQALVLPNSSSSSGFKLKYYEFAGRIVGKCLIESAIGGAGAHHVTGKFARSFLAQLIGLPVTYKYFQSDDPDLFMTKIKFILDNDVNDMEMSFSDEVYNTSGGLEKIVELISHGENIPVTNDNKHTYLTKFAQFRLSKSIKLELKYFIKGLTSIVPKEILSIMEENDLELVMCGMSKISVEDMRAHVNTDGVTDNKILDWFWTALSGFNQDELARLLQFITGCPQLPIDGFIALSPKLKISTLDYRQGGLPSAHTCFNEFCLPKYKCYEDLNRMLKIAINEGATGFGLA